jgi:hypothetical protein
MTTRFRKTILILVVTGLFLLAIMASGCATSYSPTQSAAEEPKATQVVKTVEVEKEVSQYTATVPAAPAVPTQVTSGSEVIPPSTPTPLAQATLAPTQVPIPSPIATQENRIVQVEWPERMRMGDSDVIRLALVPAEAGYTLVTEFPEHQTITQTVPVARPGGYDLYAVARLDGVGFEISPFGDQIQYMPPDQALGWRWTLSPKSPGQQRLAINLTLRWIPLAGQKGPLREIVAYSRPLDVQVITFFGLSQTQALVSGFVGLFLGGGISLFAFFLGPGARKSPLRKIVPNQRLAIELPANLRLSAQERLLLQSLFGRYARLVIEQEFLSGYSGARAFLALPVRTDGRADAYTIAKLGEQESIRGEFANYESFVKDTLPPITARIQHAPVTSSYQSTPGRVRLAALQYTFIGEQGSTPVSLRQALLKEPNPHLLNKLFETFGPNWWLQHRPYTFRLAQEYDRLLPTHLVLEPASGQRPIASIDGRAAPGEIRAHVGDIVSIRYFPGIELRLDGKTLSLAGSPVPGQPPLRLRWLSLDRPEGATGRVIATRESLLRDLVLGCDLLGLPDPFDRLPDLLAENISGSRSTIHGDLNLENILIGPGDLLWLIDFAQTREGHTLQDFTHLYAELVAHILAPQINEPVNFLALLRHPAGEIPASKGPTNLASLLTTVDELACRCLFNPSQPREWHLSLALTCLGALKYSNLSAHARHLLYLAGA